MTITFPRLSENDDERKLFEFESRCLSLRRPYRQTRDRACKPPTRSGDEIPAQSETRFVRGTGGDIPGPSQCGASVQ